MAKPSSLSWPVRIFRFLSGYGLAVTCLLLLLVLTWLSTLEQPFKGLYEVQKRYYDAEALFVTPDLPWLYFGGKQIIIPLPGAYLVSAVLFVNLFLGGIIRIRKGWKNIGVIIAHFSMVSLLFAGFVSHKYSKEGIMFVMKGDTSDYAQSYTEYTIEVCEIVDGQKTRPYVVQAEYLKTLEPGETRTFKFPELPFDIEVSDWMRNSTVVKAPLDDTNPLAIDGMALQSQEVVPTEEENAAGCYVDVLPKSSDAKASRLLLYGPVGDAVTATVDGKIYGFTLVREIWPMPFRVRLEESEGEYYPGTNKPSSFMSVITRLAENEENKFTIKMNEPMRYGGYTLYQARWSGETERPQSGFAIVKNPSDQWPKYSLYISMLGLFIHFGVKLWSFILQSAKRQGQGPKEGAPKNA
ncbi:cytochrome c biogenesis protein ResB [Verrucomicrobiaceae bacterium R5-34]|uniref:Cytochrome c biogenesis protein ResB n=1 Tax=Oceaniferula flava TaxID=2800421 RepID=A0AAE2SCT3_9BACT|nr:cytochrome c biogenesis protein ResB [Oceaniferula flavus]MBK1830109.1 cytochrome c biogenesis protein ResB [Verrucomicrobiaceae bacterium R5-34]MBK1855022.1 cytochrome c biogenesis protein ResB [Oceaniferula flavus]MBM1136328.1 cytochrome c biogenesis protein ResB [Oceaniferula flavus]